MSFDDTKFPEFKKDAPDRAALLASLIKDLEDTGKKLVHEMILRGRAEVALKMYTEIQLSKIGGGLDAGLTALVRQPAEDQIPF